MHNYSEDREHIDRATHPQDTSKWAITFIRRRIVHLDRSIVTLWSVWVITNIPISHSSARMVFYAVSVITLEVIGDLVGQIYQMSPQ